MASVERLLSAYERRVRLPWEKGLAGPQKIWFAFYAPTDEKRVRARLGAFETATKQVGHTWRLCDLTDTFAVWMAGQEYRESYFQSPEDIEIALDGYALHVTQMVQAILEGAEADENTVVALNGLASLFGLMRGSSLAEAVSSSIRGRLLLFFPGERDGANYRMLEARDGWNYLGIPITAEEG